MKYNLTLPQENVTEMVRNKYSEFRRVAEQSSGEGGVHSGIEAWKRIVVTLVFDGLDPADKETLEYAYCLLLRCILI